MRALAGRVSGLWVYPVKSMRGQALDAVQVETRGLVGDRMYAVRDEAGKFGSGKNTRRFARMDRLAFWSARRSGDGVEVLPPDGDWLDGASETAAALLSARIGRRIQITREADVSHFDAAPVHILTAGDLAFLETLSGVRPRCESFRPNVLIETDERSSDWLGERLRMGGVELEIVAPTERCLMVNFAPDGRPGPEFLRPLAQNAEACFGVYAAVLRAGELALGEAVARGA
ncbi:MAG TPA: MOSC N-terminal beta barrel domain-containing protein [Rhodoblastus sp.]|nr:MOSC N-terminal beta barrel domain-containing protein [Rhodoblastus sp.]